MAFQLAEAFVEFKSQGHRSVERAVDGIRQSLVSLNQAVEGPFYDFLSASGNRLNSVLSSAAKQIRALHSLMQNLGQIVGGPVSSAFSVASSGVTTFSTGLTRVLSEFSNHKRNVKILNAQIRATGGVAGVTSEELQQLSRDLQNTTAFSEESTLAAQGLLLNFTNVRGDVFREAVEAAMNMATVLGQDLKGAIVHVGEALNDPVGGLSKLTDVGVSFTQQQRRQIATLLESNDVLGAQQMILQQLRDEFGGAAESELSTFTGQLQSLSNAFGSVLNSIAKMLDNSKSMTSVIGGLRDFLVGLNGDSQALANIFENSVVPALLSGFKTIAQAASLAIDAVGFFGQGIKTLQLAALETAANIANDSGTVRNVVDERRLRELGFAPGSDVSGYSPAERKEIEEILQRRIDSQQLAVDAANLRREIISTRDRGGLFSELEGEFNRLRNEGRQATRESGNGIDGNAERANLVSRPRVPSNFNIGELAMRMPHSINGKHGRDMKKAADEAARQNENLEQIITLIGQFPGIAFQ